MALLFLLRYSVLAEQPHLIENRSAFYLWLRLCRAVLNSFLSEILMEAPWQTIS
jgi:hypothetical protein